MKVRIHQKVKIKNIEPGTIQEGCLFVEEMVRFWGKEAIVTGAIGDTKKSIRLYGPIGINNFSWRQEWFDIIEDFPSTEDFLEDKDFEI